MFANHGHVWLYRWQLDSYVCSCLKFVAVFYKPFSIIISVLHEKVKDTEVKWLVQDYIASKWWNQSRAQANFRDYSLNLLYTKLPVGLFRGLNEIMYSLNRWLPYSKSSIKWAAIIISLEEISEMLKNMVDY